MVRSEIVHTLDSAFHMLRHFEELPAPLAEQLLAKGYAKETMEESLRAPGSRFATDFAQTIEDLLDRLFIDSSFSVGDGMNGNLLVHATVNSDKFNGGVGTCGVVAIDSLEESLRPKIYREKNRGVELWHLDVVELPQTDEFTLILKPANEHFIFITAFPGPPALPLPDHRMPSALYDTCRTFWENHVFLNTA